ncbi:DUF802 domain-containing protein, partial [Achromobacter denitrificans]
RDEERLAAWTGTLARSASDITAQTQAQTTLLEGVSARLETAAASVTQAWTDAQWRQEQINAKLANDNQQALENATAAFERQATALLGTLDQSHAQLQDTLA